jgi:hypothetical protein
MFGFVFGTLCLIGFAKVAFGHRGRWHRRWGGGWHGGYGACGGSHWGPSRALYWGFQRLDTSPGQEKAIRSALSEMWQGLATLRPALHAIRKETGVAFAQEGFNAQVAEERLRVGEIELDQARKLVSGTLAKIHEVLDPDQRQRVAKWLESGHGAYC